MTMTQIDRSTSWLLQSGTYTRFQKDTLPYPEANKLFER